MNSGVEIVLARMSTHPEEFYGDNDKWKFIYKEYFRDAMTEQEKGAIFDRIKEIRKEEFTLYVMKAMTADKQEEDWDEREVAGYAVPNKKKIMRLNSNQLAAAQSLSKKAGISFDQAVKTLGYK